MSTGHVAAVDLGATSGRVVLATVGPGVLDVRPVSRFANDPVTLWNGERGALHWDVPGLYGNVCRGLAEAARQVPDLVGVGVDSWAVDYGLLRQGRLLGLPHHYRDDRSSAGVESVHAVSPHTELYRRNGLQFLSFTTVYQLAAERIGGMLDLADRALLVPDLIGYWLTGRMVTERTNASTTGLLGIDGAWDDELMSRLGLHTELFADLVDPGTDLGPLLPAVVEQLGLDAGVRVSTVASHDTASAVAAVPMAPESSAYVSCGTWGLVGVELGAPVLDDAARAANFTNELGADGRTRFLHNVMGLWLLSESVRHWQRGGAEITLPALLEQAADCPPPADVFDANDPRFLAPGDIPGRIREWYAERGLPGPTGLPETVRAILESLAAAFADGVRTASELSGTPIETVHVVGGGAQNRLLCQLLADRVGVPVLAGPVEATAIGNVLIQARAHRLLDGGLDALRSLVAQTYPPKRFLPQSTFVGGARP